MHSNAMCGLIKSQRNKYAINFHQEKKILVHETLSREQCHKYIYHEYLTHHDFNTTQPEHVDQRVVSS